MTFTLRTHGGKLVRTYWVSDSGGYVYEIAPHRPGTLGWQISSSLAHTGDMMSLRDASRLPAAIRAARRRERASERKCSYSVLDFHKGY